MIEIRKVTTEGDWRAVQEMRSENERDFVGTIPLPVNATWFVAARDDRVIACAGVVIVGEGQVMITDLYDDGTYGGRRGLCMLLRDALHSRVKLFVSVPFDRPDLRAALERKGFVFKNWEGEYT